MNNNPNKGEEIDWEKGYGKPPKEYPYTDEEVEFLKKYPHMTLAFVHAKATEKHIKDQPLEKESWEIKFNSLWAEDDTPRLRDFAKEFIKQVLSSEAVLKGERRRIIAQIKEEVLEDYKAELLGKIEGLTVYYRSKFSQDCSRNETEQEKNTEMIELQDIKAIISPPKNKRMGCVGK